MIYNKITQINKNVNFFDEDFKKYQIEQFKQIIADNFLKKRFFSIKKTYTLFISPKSYFKSKLKSKILLPINLDKFDGKIENLFIINELKKKNLSKLEILQSFLSMKGKKKIYFIDKILMKLFRLKISKHYFYRNFYLITLKTMKKFKYVIKNGYFLGKSSYNCFFFKSKKFIEDFKIVYSNLSDSESKKTYKTCIFGHPSTLFNLFVKKLKKNNQYFDYINLNTKSVVINCGVDKGYEIPEYLSFNIQHLYNIDPSGNKFLHPYVQTWSDFFKKKITYINKALYDDSNCYVHKNNQTTNLASIIKQHKINKIDLIKADIEGGEKKLIEELPDIVKNFRPQLSLAIYHVDDKMINRFCHLTYLPKKLFQICKNYFFFIGHYTWDRRETIIYCIPKEKYN